MRSLFGSAAVIAIFELALGHPVQAASSTVNITMRDESIDNNMHAMRMLLDHANVPPGSVTFDAMNESKTLVHEMIIVKVKSADEKLPYDLKTSEVIEGRVRKFGEISDLRPGGSGKLTVDLAPGSYLLLCNQPGHYKAGMWTTLKVSR